MDAQTSATHGVRAPIDAAPLTRRGRRAAQLQQALPDFLLRGTAVRPTGIELPMDTVEQREQGFRHSLAAADGIAAIIAAVLCVTALGEDQLRWSTVLAIPLIIVIAKLSGLYDRDELVIHKSTLEEAPKLFSMAALSSLAFWLLEGVMVTGQLGKEQVVFLTASFFALSVTGRTAARTLAATRTELERCLVLGDAEVYERIQQKLDGRRGVALIGSVPIEHVDGDILELRRIMAERNVHRVIFAPHAVGSYESTLDLVRAAKAIGVRVSILPSMIEVVGTSVVFDDIGGLTLLGVRRFGLSRSSRAVKRAFDLSGSLFLLFCAAPLMAAAAVAIKLTSKGPVFYKQTRVGRNGQRFQILKFRTMVVGAHAMREELQELNEAQDGLFKIKDDPRITKAGKLLRKTSLDELPQLLNVVRGEMSLVGPRPLVENEDDLIKGFDRRRLALTPGMTGPWQVMGSARVPLSEMVKIDYLYVAGWSLWADIKILLRTVSYVVTARSC